jgi:hypothetical protein
MAGDAPDQRPPAPDPGRVSPAEHGRLVALHELAPGLAARPPLVAVAYLMAASSPAERETAAAAHDAQAAQLRGPIPAAFARTYLALAPLWSAVGFRSFGPGATVAQVLQLAAPELAERVRGDLAAAGVDPDATGWPPL